MDPRREFREGPQLRAFRAESMSQDGSGGFTGTLVPYGVEIELYPGLWEVFEKGALRGAVKDPARVKVMSEGHSRRVIGMASKLESRDDGLWGEFVFDSGQDAQDHRRKMTDGFLDQLSIEFREVPGGTKEEKRGEKGWLIKHSRARLLGVSPVPHGAYGGHAAPEKVRDRRDAERDAAIAALKRLNH